MMRVGRLAKRRRLAPTTVWVLGLAGLAQAVASTGDEELIAALRRPPTAIDNMSPRNPGLRILTSIPVPSRIPAHSIIAINSRQGGGA